MPVGRSVAKRLALPPGRCRGQRTLPRRRRRRRRCRPAPGLRRRRPLADSYPQGGRPARLHPLERDDTELFRAVLASEHAIAGFCNQNMTARLYRHPAATPEEGTPSLPALLDARSPSSGATVSSPRSAAVASAGSRPRANEPCRRPSTSGARRSQTPSSPPELSRTARVLQGRPHTLRRLGGGVSSPALLRGLGNAVAYEAHLQGVPGAWPALGRAARTIVLLRYLSEPELRDSITTTTYRVESFHNFSSGSRSATPRSSATMTPTTWRRSSSSTSCWPTASSSTNAAELTVVLNQLAAEGHPVRGEDVAALSPLRHQAHPPLRRLRPRPHSADVRGEHHLELYAGDGSAEPPITS